MKQKLEAPSGYIVCGSHRARSHAFRVIGRATIWRSPMTTSGTRGIYLVTTDELARCVRLKGVRRLAAKREGFLRACW